MARKPKTPRAAPASSAAEVRVKMTAAFTYQLGPSARRTLPAGWCGMVPAAIATRLEAEKAGAGVTVEEEGDVVVSATTKPPKPAATTPAAPKPAATSAADAKPSASAATGDSASKDQADASQSPQPAATSPAAPAAAEPGAPAAPAAPEAGGASVDPQVGSAEGNQTSVSAAPESGTAPDPSDDTGA